MAKDVATKQPVIHDPAAVMLCFKPVLDTAKKSSRSAAIPVMPASCGSPPHGDDGGGDDFRPSATLREAILRTGGRWRRRTKEPRNVMPPRKQAFCLRNSIFFRHNESQGSQASRCITKTRQYRGTRQCDMGFVSWCGFIRGGVLCFFAGFAGQSCDDNGRSSKDRHPPIARLRQ